MEFDNPGILFCLNSVRDKVMIIANADHQQVAASVRVVNTDVTLHGNYPDILANGKACLSPA